MPILNRDDAAEVRDNFDQFFEAEADERPGILRGLFTEILDFERVDGRLALAPARERAGIELPAVAERIASLDGVNVLYVDLSVTERVRRSEVVAVARLVRDTLQGEDMLLLFSNAPTSQLHWIYPDFGSCANPTLKRMVVERDLPRRTVVQQISNIYWRHRELGNLLDSIKEAFDVEPVTKEFFKQYKTLFEAAEDKIKGFGDTDQGREDRKQFVQTLFNRLMFVYFLSRKGWLTYRGSTDYLNALWDDYEADGRQQNFYEGRLHRLFFLALNNPEGRDLTGSFKDRFLSELIGNPPFLNGGLFQEEPVDSRNDIVVPDDAIRRLMTELFDKFNFTVMESTPFDIEVAVDPEMLGKVFEELVTGRHDSGAYYTPRPVVSFMCREALIGYLGSHAPDVNEEALRRLVEDDDASQIPRATAPAIGAALDRVTVVDPACGSGAYLVGMMQELLELYGALYSERLLDDPKSLYELKLHIIERNLHGVDLDPFAVNIAMLRLWLSLAIEFEGDQPEPLPNLDFKIVEGDSLLGPDPSQISLDSHAIQQSKLGQLKSAYLRAKTADGKARLRQGIEDARETIRNTLADANLPENAVDWRIDFAEIIAEGGFDIAVANPPYVESRSSSVSPDLKNAYLNRVEGDWGASLPRGSDLLMYFFAKAAGIISSTGRAVFITQNAWLHTDYGYAFQQFSLGRFSFSKVIDSEGKFFDSSAGPMINAIICFFSKRPDGRLEYGMADKALNISAIRAIAPRSKYKWGTLFAMPESLDNALATLDNTPEYAMDLRIGQGLNFPKREINCKRCSTPLFIGDGNFAAVASNATAPPIGSKRARRIPALVMPRGVGDRYFCTFNACRAFSYSGVEVYLPESLWLSDTHYCLWVFLNSSLAWLFREVTGRKNLGGGMLKAEATDMKRLPMQFAYNFGGEAREIYHELKERRALTVKQEIETPAHLRLDDIVGEFFGIGPQMPAMREDLVRLVKFRSDRSAS